MRFRFLVLFLFCVPLFAEEKTASTRPIIDVHLHAGPNKWTGPGAPADSENEKHFRGVISQMDQFNVKLAIISGPMDFVEYWKKSEPQRFIASVMFPCDKGQAPLGGRQCFPSGSEFPDLKWLTEHYANKSLGAMGELTTQYAGLSSSDLSLEPYYSLAEKFDIPVGLHTGLSYPGIPYTCCPKFRAALGRPMLIEDALVRHPKLRVYLMHAGYPFVEDTIAMMTFYPQLHLDLSALNYLMPKPMFHSYLQNLINHGFAKRILFGSDDFPLENCIEAIESAAFLTDEQKNDIFCANAERFLKLEPNSICNSKPR
jgi:hypothetical protein